MFDHADRRFTEFYVQDMMSGQEILLLDHTNNVEGASPHEHDQDAREETEGMPSDVEEEPITGDETSDDDALFVKSSLNSHKGAHQPSPSPIANSEMSLISIRGATMVVSTDPSDMCDSDVEMAKDLDKRENTDASDDDQDGTARAETQDSEFRDIDSIIAAGQQDDLLKGYYTEYGIMRSKQPVIQRI